MGAKALIWVWKGTWLAGVVLLSLPLSAAPESPATCARFALHITNGNFHRSQSPELSSGQIWRFEPGGQLAIFVSGSGGLRAQKRLGDVLWRVEFEDSRCVLRVAATTKPSRWTTYQIVDTTWAFAKGLQGEEIHVPDFEDQTAAKTRYCGRGDRCERLWK